MSAPQQIGVGELTGQLSGVGEHVSAPRQIAVAVGEPTGRFPSKFEIGVAVAVARLALGSRYLL